MENILSKGEDCLWLAQKLKEQMKDDISFSFYGIDNPILTGHLYPKSQNIKFFIKYCKDEFLRIQINTGFYKSELISQAIEDLTKALSSIEQGETPIGFPLAIYEVQSFLTSEYAFKNIDETIIALQDNTLYDNADIKNLRFVKKCINCGLSSQKLDTNTRGETLYCQATSPIEYKTSKEDSCMDHEFIDGVMPNIKVLTMEALNK